MNLYAFSCQNLTNIWAGIGAGMWAVSGADEKARRTRARSVEVGSCGIIYCSAEDAKYFTTPFIFVSKPDPDKRISNVWPEVWHMPFSIHPIGSPRKTWSAKDAALQLPFNVAKSDNISEVFKIQGTTVFSPMSIGTIDWAMFLDTLAEF